MPPKPIPAPLPYKRNDHFLSKSELSFYHALKEVMAPNVTVCPKVRLVDIIADPHPGHTAFFNKVVQKHVDFLLCNSLTMQPVAAVELNGSSHELKHRQTRDQFMCDALQAANIPLFMFPVQQSYTTQDILKHLAANNTALTSHSITGPHRQ